MFIIKSPFSLSILLFLLAFVTNFTFAQSTTTTNTPKVIIKGTITNPVDFTVKLRYWDNPLENPVMMETPLQGGNTFIIPARLNRPRILELVHGEKSVEIYLEPNTRMEINFDGKQLLETITFSGDNVNNNVYLIQQQRKGTDHKYAKKTIEAAPFHSRSDAATLRMMESREPAVFLKKIDKQLEDKASALNKFHEKHALSPAFKKLQERNILYWRQIHQLNYLSQNGGSQMLNFYPESLDIKSGSVNLDDSRELAHNPTYKWLLYAYGNYVVKKHHVGTLNPDDEQTAVTYFDLINQHMPTSWGKQFLLSALLVQDIKSKKYTLTDERKRTFYKNNPHADLGQLVESAYNNSQRLVPGTPAPSFNLSKIDDLDTYVSSYDFEGQLVYVSFWSSTCTNCINNFKKLKSLKKEFARKGIVFVNIALDKDRDACLSLIRDLGIDGINLIAPEQYSEVKYAYKIFFLPGYFVIDKNGLLTSLKGSLDSVEGKLNRLVQINSGVK